eukprot:6468159-Amphidinium_carterae.7
MPGAKSTTSKVPSGKHALPVKPKKRSAPAGTLADSMQKKNKVDGPLVCGLCSKSSEEVVRMGSNCLNLEKKWALYTKENGTLAPEGTQCEKCYTLWKAGFTHLTWDHLCLNASSDQEFKRFLQAAEKTLDGTEEKPKGERVYVQQSHGLQLERVFLCVTEREMRKEGNLQRVPRACLKGLNSVEVPSACGTFKETAYLFVHPSHPFRTCRMTVNLQTNYDKPVLEPADTLYEGQGEGYATIGIEKMADATYSALASREQSGHLATMEWEDFLQNHLSKDAGEEGEEGAAAAAEAPAIELTGVAAPQTDIGSCSIQKKRRGVPPSAEKLVRAASSTSLGGRDGDASVVSGTACDAVTDFGDSPVAGLTGRK